MDIKEPSIHAATRENWLNLLRVTITTEKNQSLLDARGVIA